VEVPKLNNKNIRVPTPAWSNSFLEQNRFLIDIGLHLLLLAIAISPFVVLYVKRKSPSGWLDLAFLLLAMLGLPFASSYAESILPSHQLVFVRGYAGLCFVVLAITFVMVSWRFKASTRVGSSSHTNFIHIVFGDGSTRAIPKSIDDRVFRKILLGEFKDDTDFP